MKFAKHLRAPFSIWAVVALAAVLITGCVTQEQVQSIVNESNFHLLTAEADAAASQLQPNPDNRKEAPDVVLARIDAFIAQHADKPALTAPLRLRQAILFLNKGSFSSADAAIASIGNKDALHTERDRTIYEYWEALAWWYSHASESGTEIVRSQRAEADRTMARFLEAADKIKDTPDLRDYMLEARAWIGLKLAGGLEGRERANVIKDAIDVFGQVLTEPEAGSVAEGRIDRDTPAFSRSARVVLRADTLLDAAARLARGLPADERPRLTSPELQRALDSKITR